MGRFSSFRRLFSENICVTSNSMSWILGKSLPVFRAKSSDKRAPGKDTFLQTVTSSVENIVFPSVKIRSPSAISEQEKLSNSKLRIHTRTNSGRVTYRFL